MSKTKSQQKYELQMNTEESKIESEKIFKSTLISLSKSNKYYEQS